MKKKLFIIILICLLFGIPTYFALNDGGNISESIDTGISNLLDQNYKAPELSGLTDWINSPNISSISDLKGKVVVVDFWTYSCINCIRTLPYLNNWHEKYAKDGLVILGVHAPEFAFERIPENVEMAVKEYGVKYPVALDNDFSTWKNYNNRFWPAKYIIDKDGNVRYQHFGEGKYDETEEVIATLLGVDMKAEIPNDTYDVNFDKIDSPETYLGLARRENFVEKIDSIQLKLNQWTYTGKWVEGDENIENTKSGDAVFMRFKSSNLNLVLAGKGKAEIYLDGKLIDKFAGKDVKNGVVEIGENKLYELVDQEGDYSEHLFEIRFLVPGVKVYAFTFG